MSKHLSDHHGAHMLVQPATVQPVLVSLDYFRRPGVWGDTQDRSAGKGTQKKKSIVCIDELTVFCMKMDTCDMQTIVFTSMPASRCNYPGVNTRQGEERQTGSNAFVMHALHAADNP